MKHNLAVRQPFRQGPLLGGLLVLCVLAGGIAWASVLGTRLTAMTDAINTEGARIGELQGRLRDAERIATPRRQAQAIMAALNRDAVDPTILRRLEPAAPDDVWLVSANLSRGRLLIDGQALAWPSIATFAEALSRVSGLTNVQLNSLQARGDNGEYDFHLSAIATEPVPQEALR